MRKFACVLSVVALIGFAASTAQATIIWGAAQNVAGDTDVSTSGTLLHAYAGQDTTVNTVPFTRVYGGTNGGGTTSLTSGTSSMGIDTLTTIGGNVYHSYTFAPATGVVSDAYRKLLGGGPLTNSAPSTWTYTINGLTNAKDYQVQVWVNCSIVGSFGESLDGTTVLNSNVSSGKGQYALGTFHATGTSQSFTYASSPGTSVFNLLSAIQVREVPEPSTIVLLGMGVMGLLAYAWRKRK